ncbi:MAG: penicillin-binding protein [Syntrophobacterales bacterium CG_4_9_14_3_um_filter_49_8]|nr:MAG: penicillin-binding protein [Syntrophobacterales bacterium CG23_combo_of_CG06-09_8_20_14_all_48_27]PJA48248.1 MAG: penicillin-binding protein [Syntrophobacterales bacterium CG_4_9_14_3_um_filter_49_8]
MTKQSSRNYKKKKRRDSHLGTIVLLTGLFTVLLALGGGGLLYYTLLRDMPAIATLKDYRPSITTRVYADDNELIDEFYLEDRKVIRISELPKVVIQAFVAAEDTRFYQHKGVDILSIMRAFFKNIVAGHIVQGGSTITQQVAKSLYLSPERNYMRKIKEAILAYKIDKYLSKDEILNLYLNHIYLGHGTYGIEAASQGYFGKSARDLILPEAALLAGLPKSPSNYSPYAHLDMARQRQLYVLTRMLEDGYITAQEKEKAIGVPVKLRSIRPKEKIAPYFIENVRRYILEKYGSDVLYREGLEVYTTLNITVQKAAMAAVERGLRELEERQRYRRGLVQGALFCMDARTGAIRAMVGGRNFKKSEFNRATQARRQPGSAFKPFIYTAAFDKGMTSATKLMDSPIMFIDATGENIWKPQNFDGEFWGPTTLRTALVHSRNIITIKLLQEIGVDYAAQYAANMGITSPLTRNLSLALGTSGVTLQEMVRGYGVLANQGKKCEPFFIKKIVDRTGHVFEENQPITGQMQVIDPRIAFMTTDVMQDVVESGTGMRVKSIGRPVAGKTGTTDDMRDAWFIGFTPSLVTGVWVGFDQERPLGKQEVGGRAAAPIWLYFMEKAIKDTPVESFPIPEGIAFIEVDPKTGLPGKSSSLISQH